MKGLEGKVRRRSKSLAAHEGDDDSLMAAGGEAHPCRDGDGDASCPGPTHVDGSCGASGRSSTCEAWSVAAFRTSC